MQDMVIACLCTHQVYFSPTCYPLQFSLDCLTRSSFAYDALLWRHFIFYFQIKSLGAKAGVVLNPATPLTTIEYVLDGKKCFLCWDVFRIFLRNNLCLYLLNLSGKSPLCYSFKSDFTYWWLIITCPNIPLC